MGEDHWQRQKGCGAIGKQIQNFMYDNVGSPCGVRSIFNPPIYLSNKMTRVAVRLPAPRNTTEGSLKYRHEATTRMHSVGTGNYGGISSVDEPVRRYTCLQRDGSDKASSLGPKWKSAHRRLLLAPLPGDRI